MIKNFKLGLLAAAALLLVAEGFAFAQMGGMGGGMGGGMMGGMGGGMRSVPPTGLPTALLNPGQTRHLPTRLVSITPPDAGAGLQLPEKDEPLRIVGDVADVNDLFDLQLVRHVQHALGVAGL